MMFTREELEAWLLEIALNNHHTHFGNAAEEIANRLDGFEQFVEDRRREAEHGTS